MKLAQVLAISTLTLCTGLLVAVPAQAAGESDVTVVNQSDWTIHHLFLSPVEEESWGPDQLGEEVVPPDHEFTVHSIPCDIYDVRLIDEDGDECVVPEVELCADSDVWVITNEDLLACEGY